MIPARISKLTLALSLAAALAAVSTSGFAQSSPSGFIQNLPADMKADPAGPGSMRWQSPATGLGAYSKILLEPLTIYIAPDSEEKGLDPEALKSLSDWFREIVINKLEPAYPVVDKPGPGVLVLRPALTNLQLASKSRGVLQTVTPMGWIVYAARDAHSKRYSVDKASLEVEALDGASGERVAVLIDRAPEKSGLREEQYLNWTFLENTLNFYAGRLRNNLDAAQKK
jgi:hypothetical protein